MLTHIFDIRPKRWCFQPAKTVFTKPDDVTVFTCVAIKIDIKDSVNLLSADFGLVASNNNARFAITSIHLLSLQYFAHKTRRMVCEGVQVIGFCLDGGAGRGRKRWCRFLIKPCPNKWQPFSTNRAACCVRAELIVKSFIERAAAGPVAKVSRTKHSTRRLRAKITRRLGPGTRAIDHRESCENFPLQPSLVCVCVCVCLCGNLLWHTDNFNVYALL